MSAINETRQHFNVPRVAALGAGRVARGFWIAACAALAACGGGGGGGGGGAGDSSTRGSPLTASLPSSGAGVLSVSPLDNRTLVAATPLGNLNPPGHMTPTDHVYLYFVASFSTQQQSNDCSARPVYAAGSGLVTFIRQTESAGDTEIMVQMPQTFMYDYDHALVEPGVTVGAAVQAVDVIATTTGRCPSIDLGVIDLDVTLPGLVNPLRYGDYGAHAASPYKYFTDPLRSLYYNDWYADMPRVVIGGTRAEAGVLVTDAVAPDFASVSTTSGIVAYACTSTSGRPLRRRASPLRPKSTCAEAARHHRNEPRGQ